MWRSRSREHPGIREQFKGSGQFAARNRTLRLNHAVPSPEEARHEHRRHEHRHPGPRAGAGHGRPAPLRLQAGTQARARAVQLVRGRVQLHLAVDRHLHAVRAGPDHPGRGVHLDLAGGGPRPVHRRAELRRDVQPLSGGRLGLPVDQVPGEPELLLVHRLDLPVRRHHHRHRGGRDPAAGAHPGAERARLAQPGRRQLGHRAAHPGGHRADHARGHHGAEHLRRAAGRVHQQHRRAVRDPRHVRLRADPAGVPQPSGLQGRHRQRGLPRWRRARSWPRCS